MGSLGSKLPLRSVNDLCLPAKVYLGFQFLNLVVYVLMLITLRSGGFLAFLPPFLHLRYITAALFMLAYVYLFTWLVNALCRENYKMMAWVVVLATIIFPHALI